MALKRWTARGRRSASVCAEVGGLRSQSSPVLPRGDQIRTGNESGPAHEIEVAVVRRAVVVGGEVSVAGSRGESTPLVSA